jgi:SAM-dependent methyltransferase
MSNDIIRGVSDYYSKKIGEHGPGYLGVDWNSKESQYLRFEQLCRVIEPGKFSILDYGCGYGELINFLKAESRFNFNYTGYDISPQMIKAATGAFKNTAGTEFVSALHDKKFDYTVASGIFNVKLDLAGNETWLKYILETLQQFNDISIKGFSFNALTVYSDKEYMKDYLYYADPGFLFDHCMKNFSRNVALLHDYKLYEFTIIVRK